MTFLQKAPAFFWRGVSTSAYVSNVKTFVSARQQAKLMTKFLAAAKKREKQLLAVGAAGGDVSDGGATCGGSRVRPLRATSAKHRHRLDALSAIYLGRITEVLSTGEVLPGLLESGVIISKVQLSGNMRQVYVFWTPPASADERAIAERLETESRDLRTVLTQQRVTGHVPGIKFVRDSDNTSLLEVERRLATADFGPDFEPTDPTHFVRRQSVLGRPVSASDTEDLLRRDVRPPGSADPQPLEMPHTAGGLNRAAILEQLQQQIQRAAAPHRQVTVHPEAVTPAVPSAAADVTESTERASFGRFTRQRKWARLRQNKVNTSINLDDWESFNRGSEDDVDQDNTVDASSSEFEDVDLKEDFSYKPMKW